MKKIHAPSTSRAFRRANDQLATSVDITSTALSRPQVGPSFNSTANGLQLPSPGACDDPAASAPAPVTPAR